MYRGKAPIFFGDGTCFVSYLLSMLSTALQLREILRDLKQKVRYSLLRLIITHVPYYYIYIYIYVCVCVYIYVCMCVCVCVYIYIYIYI